MTGDVVNISGVTIAALKGASGKTVISTGIAAALKDTGVKTRAFKKGPDFIDSSWLAAATGASCYNLDTFMMEESGVLDSFARKSAGFDISIIEGNRGLFDGLDHDGTQSTARLAKILGTPVILVVDASKSTRTVAAMVHGCMTFDGGCDIKGVILNRVAGIRHQDVVKRAIEKYCGVPVIGAVPKLDDILPERHMGLVPPQETGERVSVIRKLSEIMKDCVDLDAVVSIARMGAKAHACETRSVAVENVDGPVIGVFRDSAFQFYYEENLEALREQGAALVEISPLVDGALPAVDGLYLGGGFPETHAMELSANKDFIKSFRAAIGRGLPVYAECGGLVYLGRSISVDGAHYEMSGALPFDFTLEKRPSRHGYSILEAAEKTACFDRGAIFRAHEFHYTRITNWKESGMRTTLEMKRGCGVDGRGDGIAHGSVFAMYNHIHARSAPGWAGAMVASAAKFRNERKTRAAL